MPLVAEKIVVPFDSDAKALIDETNRANKELEEFHNNRKKEAAEAVRLAKEQEKHTKFAKDQYTDLRAKALDAIQLINAGWEQTIGKFVTNAVEAGNFARALGTTTEEASRLKEISDDVGISTDSLRIAFQTAQKDGFVPTVEGLAKMSDEYLALQPGVERTQFLVDRFGKSGAEMGKLLEHGSAGIREMSAAVDENLVVTQQAYLDARKYQIAVDDLSDSWSGFTMSLGKAALPKAIGLLGEMNSNIEESGTALGILRFGWDDVWRGLSGGEETLDEIAMANTAAADTADEAALAFESEAEMTKRLEEEAKAAEQAIRDMTQANQRELDIIGTLAKETESYTDKQTDLQAKHDELLAKKKELIRQGWWEESDKVREVNQALAENAQAQQENAAEYEMASQRRILARAEELLSIDGLTNAEKEGLIERGIAMGIYTEEAAAKMREEEQAAYNLSAALNSIPREIITNVFTNYQTATGTPGAYGFDNNTTHAIGGSFEIPQGYGNEGFMMGGGDTASGGEKLTVTPAGQDVIDYKKMARAIRDAMLAVG